MAGQKTDERDVYLGQRMADNRKRSQLTQRRVAKSFGVSAAQLQKYEKGVNRISAIHLDILSRLTGVPIGDFFEGIPHFDDAPETWFGENEQAPFADEDPVTSLATVIGKHISENFPEENVRALRGLVDALQRELAR